MSRRKSNSGAALDVGASHAVARSAAGAQFEPSFARISGVRSAPRPPTWPPPLPADRVPVPPPKGRVATRTSQQPAPSPSAAPPPLRARAVPAPAPASVSMSARPSPSSTIAWPAPAVSSQASAYPNPTTRRTERLSPAPPAPLQACAYVLPFRAAASPASARGPFAAPSVPDETFWRQRPRVGWMLLLALLSAAAGAVLRDRLPVYAIDGVRGTFAHPSAWLYAHVAAMSAAPTGHPLPARPESLAPPAVTAGVAPSNEPSAKATPPARAEPPEVSVSSLPIASTGPRAAPRPARAAAFAPSIPRTRVAAHPARSTAATEESTAPAPKAPRSRTPARVPPPMVNKAPAPAPGSLDDLIRKEVEKDQKKH
jgi:hypothetical protein